MFKVFVEKIQKRVQRARDAPACIPFVNRNGVEQMLGCEYDGSNDPSAGSPTETLLRLLLPLDDKV